MFDIIDPLILYYYRLTISNTNSEFNNALKNGSVTLDVIPRNESLNCTGPMNLTVSYNGSECGERTCLYKNETDNRPIIELVNVINKWFKDKEGFFIDLILGRSTNILAQNVSKPLFNLTMAGNSTNISFRNASESIIGALTSAGSKVGASNP